MLLLLAVTNGLLAQDNDSDDQAAQTNEAIDPPDVLEIGAPKAAEENQKTSFDMCLMNFLFHCVKRLVRAVK